MKYSGTFLALAFSRCAHRVMLTEVDMPCRMPALDILLLEQAGERLPISGTDPGSS